MKIRKWLMLYIILLVTYFAKGQTNDTENKRIQLINQQYRSQVQLFKQGKLDYAEMPNLVYFAKIKEKDNGKLSHEILNTWKTGYLDKLPDAEAFKIENLMVLDAYWLVIDSKDRYFKYLLNVPLIDDSISRKDGISFSPNRYLSTKRDLITYRVITKEEIDPKLYDVTGRPVNNPKFAKIESIIRKKYPSIGEDASEIVLSAKMKYYKTLNDWPAYCNALVEKADKFGRFSIFSFSSGVGASPDYWLGNELTSTLVMHCNDPKILEKAISWEQDYLMKWFEKAGTRWSTNPSQELRFSPNNDLGNYAGLLYKAGRKEEAINWMEFKVKIEERANLSGTRKAVYSGAFEALTLMKQGTPIDDSWQPKWFN